MERLGYSIFHIWLHPKNRQRDFIERLPQLWASSLDHFRGAFALFSDNAWWIRSLEVACYHRGGRQRP
jgi:hypothetical protein